MSKAMEALRAKSVSELREENLSLRRELFNLRMQQAVQQTGRVSDLRKARRNIARVLTVLAEKAKNNE